jgi:Fe-S-cluster-containing hydrogenase component 2
MLEKAGIPTSDDINLVVPDKKRLESGPVAVIECFREIPCDPCFYSCPFEAIKEFDDINDKPELDFVKCTGCKSCIAKCPGLAIFVVDYNKSTVSIPYELLPLPKKGDILEGLNREGKKVCNALVVSIKDPEKNDKTAVITIKVPQEYLMEVRNIKVGDQNGR